MAELVGAFAASHAPLIARDWERLPQALRTRLSDDFRELGRRVAAARPDVIVEIAPDHWVNFFIDNLPSVCIGVGTEHDGPPEPFLAPFDRVTLPGHPALGAHLVEYALARGFDPALSHRLRLDHGFCIPLWKMELDPIPPIVPVIVNALEPPMPTVARCLAWGKLIGAAIASFPEPLRVAVVASGGLSHSIGEPTMGTIDERFDTACIAAFGAGDDERLVAFLDEALRTQGNGGHEIRNWVVAHGASDGGAFSLVDYIPVREVYVGCAFASWNGVQRADSSSRSAPN
jgi:aromatic ring-opening dioxygenase catalytic subunit (LigB family)